MLHLEIEELDSKFEILAKLGEGGMGAVYKARHKVLDRLRVIKTIRPQLQHDQDLQNRFLREAQVAAELRHPHIATVHDCAFANGTAYIVMEHIEGQNIREYLRSGGRLTLEHVVAIGRQALDALGYLHSKRFVHRDISTDNLMLTWHDGLPHVTLIDLGLAKSLQTSQWHTKTGMVVGKVRYISPEQLNAGAEGVEVDARSDLYSMGVVLYELLTGQYPITGQDDMSLIAGHLYRPPRPFDETDPQAKIPMALRAVVMKALEKKPEFRWSSAREFGQSLREALEVATPLERHLTPEQQRALRLTPATAELAPGMRSRDPNMPTVTVDVPLPYAQGQISVLQRPGQTKGDLHTQPIDSEAVTAPITATLPPRPPADGGAARPRTAWLAAALALPLLAIAAWAALRPAGPDPAAAASTAATAVPAAGSTAAGPVFFGNYYAVVIGNDNYDRLPKLESAVRDAQTLGDLLERRYGFQVTRVLDGKRSAIMDALYDQIDQRTARDTLLIFFAGHGKFENDVAYWLPTDADPNRTSAWLSTGSEINQTVIGKIKARHVLVIADSCYAGAMSGGREDLATAAEPGMSREQTIARLVERPSRLVLASGGITPVLDSTRTGHSVFTGALLDRLEGNADLLEVSKVFAAIRDEVKQRSKQLGLEQDPVLAAIPGSADQGGELVFVPKSR
jgi:serine/threonine protein kinase